MKVVFDTEFLENGSTIDLISIGMVDELGREYYAISSEFNESAVWNHHWLPKNVMSHLPLVEDETILKRQRLDRSHPDVKSRLDIKHDVYKFLMAAMERSGPLELWGYFSSYDHIVLAQLFGTMMDFPPGVPMLTFDVMQEYIRLGLPQGVMPPKPKDVHNALADAKWTLEFLNRVEDYDHSQTKDALDQTVDLAQRVVDKAKKKLGES